MNFLFYKNIFIKININSLFIALKKNILSIFFVCLIIINNQIVCLAQSEQDINAINDVGLLYYNSGNYDEAIAEFKKILKINPDHDVALFNIGCVYQKKKDYKEAERAFSKVLELIPDDEEAKKRLTTVCEAWINQLLREVEIQPDNAMIHNNLGRAYLSLGNFESAYQSLSKAILLKPDLAIAHYNLAEYYFKQQNLEQAFHEIKKACEIDPKNVVFQQYLKKIALALGKDANQSLNEINNAPSREEPSVFASKKDEENLFKAGVEAFKNKKYEQALTNFEKAYRYNPNNNEVKEYIEKIKDILKNKKIIRDLFESANKKCKKEKWAEAIPLLEKAKDNPYFKEDINYLDILKTLSDAYMKTGEYLKAQTIYEELKSQNSKLFFVNYNLAQIYIYNGEYDKGEELLNEALKTDNITVEQIKLVHEILSMLAWKRKKVYIYIGFTAFLIILGLILYFFNTPKARKARYIQKCEELKSLSNWNNLINYAQYIQNYSFTPQEHIKINLIFANAYYNVEKYDECIKHAKKALTYDSSLYNAYELIAKAFIKKRATNDEAIFYYKKILKNDPDNVEILKLIAEYYIKVAKNTDKLVKKESLTDEIVESLKSYTLKDIQNRELVIFMANLLRQRKDVSNIAIQIYENSLNYNEDIKIREILAKAYFDNNLYDKAILECKKIFKENIELTQIHRIFVDSYMALNKYSELCLEYEKLLLLYPNSSDLERRLNELKRNSIQIGVSSSESTNLDNKVIEEKFKTTFETKPTQLDIDYSQCFERGLKYMNDKDYTNAISEFKIVLKGAPKFKNESYKMLTICYLKKGLLDLAYEHYKFLQYDHEMMPDDIKELSYNLARAFEEKGRFKEALEIYNIICKVDIGYKDVFDKFEELHAYVSKFN